jgi:hypothetical protein
MPHQTDPTELTQRSLRSDRTNRDERSADSSTLPITAAMPAATILPQPEEHEVRANRTAQSGRRHFGHLPEQVGNMIASCLPSDKVLLFKRTLRSKNSERETVLFQHALAGRVLDIYPNALSNALRRRLKSVSLGVQF